MGIDLEKLPKSITVSRSYGHPYIPNAFPIVTILDQTRLPHEVDYLQVTDWREVVECIKKLKVRGAPAIGVAGAAAVMLRSAEYVYSTTEDAREKSEDLDRVFIIDEKDFDPELYSMSLDYAAGMIKNARPTAVNLAWAVDGCMDIVREMLSSGKRPEDIGDALFGHVAEMIADDEAVNRRIGANGAALIPEDAKVITHCNAGSLATAFYGTALGVVYEAASQGKIEMVYSDETRPLGQGSRLTVWELSQAGVPVTLMCDDMSSYLMATEQIDAVVVGADRVAANGDTANKIGTLGLAIAARHFGVPFYVAAPTSTLDLSLENGRDIPIEMRDPSEILPEQIEGVSVLNPAFDVTPGSLITSIITENGVFAPSEISKALG